MNDTAIATQQDPGFAADVTGKRPHAVDRELSALLQDNYIVTDMRRGLPDTGGELPGTWARMSDDEVRAAGINPTLLHNGKSGFDASFYRNAEGAMVLAFTGTDEGKDWKHNFRQGLGLRDDQYDDAVKLAVRTKFALGDKVVFTGHSLGGGLAATAALVTETPAVTFNSAGVHDQTLEREGLDAGEGLIRTYAVKNEILTHLQEDSLPLRFALPDAPGHRIDLPDPDPLSFFERLVPGRMLMHRIDLHYIDTVMRAQDQAGLDVRGREPAAETRDQAATRGDRLLRDALAGLSPQRRQLGLDDDERFLNVVAGLAARAGNDGLQRIDHVIAARDGGGVFAVQGQPRDPGHRRSLVGLDEVSATPARDSAAELQAGEARQAAQTQSHDLRPRLVMG